MEVNNQGAMPQGGWGRNETQLNRSWGRDQVLQEHRRGDNQPGSPSSSLCWKPGSQKRGRIAHTVPEVLKTHKGHGKFSAEEGQAVDAWKGGCSRLLVKMWLFSDKHQMLPEQRYDIVLHFGKTLLVALLTMAWRRPVTHLSQTVPSLVCLAEFGISHWAKGITDKLTWSALALRLNTSSSKVHLVLAPLLIILLLPATTAFSACSWYKHGSLHRW